MKHFCFFILFLVEVLALSYHPSLAFSMNVSDQRRKEIYNIPGSGWTSKEWRWGYAVGTGHDCAQICRKRWNTKEARISLVNNLLYPPKVNGNLSIEKAYTIREPSFEEVKLILALKWQSGRWDGTDGGAGGYSDVLAAMSEAERYESGCDEETCSRLLVQDMMERFHLISSDNADLREMESIKVDCEDFDLMRRKCAGLVLKAVGFIEKGL